MSHFERKVNIKLAKLRRKQIPESELWNLDCTIVEFVIPRLEKFIALPPHGYPCEYTTGEYANLTEEEQYNAYINDLKTIIKGFKTYLTNDYTRSEEVTKARDLFGKLLYDLWD